MLQNVFFPRPIAFQFQESSFLTFKFLRRKVLGTYLGYFKLLAAWIGLMNANSTSDIKQLCRYTSMLLFEPKNFHFVDCKVLWPYEKGASILILRAPVSMFQVRRVWIIMWCIGDVKIMSITPSKDWSHEVLAIDSISFSSIQQRYLCGG